MQTYDPATGHTRGWVGYNAHTIFLNRLDRVFSCGSFQLPLDADETSGFDVVADGLTPQDLETLPRLAPSLVVRDDVNGSPGWRYGEWRWLLQSFGGVTIDTIPWPEKSPTKQRVAAQPSPDQPTLPLEEWLQPVIPMAMDVVDVLAAEDDTPDVTPRTLVTAFAIDGSTGRDQLYLGRARLNQGGGDAWHWRAPLTGPTPPDGRRRIVPSDTPLSPATTVADAPVRLRRGSDRGTGSGTDK